MGTRAVRRPKMASLYTGDVHTGNEKAV